MMVMWKEKPLVEKFRRVLKDFCLALKTVPLLEPLPVVLMLVVPLAVELVVALLVAQQGLVLLVVG